MHIYIYIYMSHLYTPLHVQALFIRQVVNGLAGSTYIILYTSRRLSWNEGMHAGMHEALPTTRHTFDKQGFGDLL